MAAKTKTMTLNLSSQEMEVLEKLSAKKGLSKTSIIKQALRLYQFVSLRIESGDKVFIEDLEEKKSELLLL